MFKLLQEHKEDLILLSDFEDKESIEDLCQVSIDVLLGEEFKKSVIEYSSKN
jgi:hypothetical protein